MNIVQALLLSIVEGISEFLPISSTGHLILASKLLSVAQTDFTKSFEIIIQLGAILAVVVIYFRKIVKNFGLWKKLLVAFIPTGIVGLILYKIIKTSLLGNYSIVIFSLFVGGVLMLVLERIFNSQTQEKGTQELENVSLTKSALIGVVQSISVIPGVSRAAATIYGGMGVGLNRKTAVEFSFLLAIPTMLASSAFDFYKSRDMLLQSQNLGILLVGFIGSFITALITVKWLTNYVQKHTFVGFAVYRIVAAIAFLLLIK